LVLKPSATHELDSEGDDSAELPLSFFLTSTDNAFIGATPGNGPQLNPAGGVGTTVVDAPGDFLIAIGFACSLLFDAR